MHDRGLLGRAFDVCLGIFIAALLLHFAVQLIAGIFYWLLGGFVVVTVIGGLVALKRRHDEGW